MRLLNQSLAAWPFRSAFLATAGGRPGAHVFDFGLRRSNLSSWHSSASPIVASEAFADMSRNEETALRYYEAVLTTCRLLARQPFSGRLFYHPSANGIEVVRVLYGSRDLEPILAADAEE